MAAAPRLALLLVVLPPQLQLLAATAPSRPNLLYVNVDDLRPNLGAFGQSYMVTPNLDDLAATGVHLDRHCPSWFCR